MAHPHEYFQRGYRSPVRLGWAALAVIALVVVGRVSQVAADFHTAGLVRDLLDGSTEVDYIAAVSADGYVRLSSIATLVVQILAAVLFALWVARARKNAELLVQQSGVERPKQWRMYETWGLSDPAGRYPRKKVMITWWTWALFAMSMAYIAAVSFPAGELSVASFERAALFSSVLAAITAFAAVLAVPVILGVSRLQADPVEFFREITEPTEWSAPPSPQLHRVDGSLSAVGGLGVAASVLIGLVAGFSVLSAASDWYTHNVVTDYLNDVAGVAEADLTGADAIAAATAMPQFLLTVAAGIMFLFWLWRARINSELLFGPAEHRLARGWTIGGWFCPVVNLWFPYQLVDDVHRTSTRRSGGVVLAWWLLFLGDMVLGQVLSRLYLSDDVTEQALRLTANLATVSAVLQIAAAVLVIGIIKRVGVGQAAGSVLRAEAAHQQ